MNLLQVQPGDTLRSKLYSNINGNAHYCTVRWVRDGEMGVYDHDMIQTAAYPRLAVPNVLAWEKVSL